MTPAARLQCETLMNAALRLATPFIRVRDDVLTFGQTLRSDGTYALVEVAGQERLPERDQAEAVTRALTAACAADDQVVATVMLRHVRFVFATNGGTATALCIDFDHHAGGFGRLLIRYDYENGYLRHHEPVVLDRRVGVFPMAAAELPVVRPPAPPARA